MKLYVDADETLVKWGMSLEINKELVELLHQGLRKDTYDITIWSVFGKDWAKKYTEMLFPEFILKKYFLLMSLFLFRKWAQYKKLTSLLLSFWIYEVYLFLCNFLTIWFIQINIRGLLRGKTKG